MGRVTEASLLQPANAFGSMLKIAPDMVTEVSAVQPSNALLPSLDIRRDEAIIVAVVQLVRPLNALLPTWLTALSPPLLSPTTTLVIWEA